MAEAAKTKTSSNFEGAANVFSFGKASVKGFSESETTSRFAAILEAGQKMIPTLNLDQHSKSFFGWLELREKRKVHIKELEVRERGLDIIKDQITEAAKTERTKLRYEHELISAEDANRHLAQQKGIDIFCSSIQNQIEQKNKALSIQNDIWVEEMRAKDVREDDQRIFIQYLQEAAFNDKLTYEERSDCRQLLMKLLFSTSEHAEKKVSRMREISQEAQRYTTAIISAPFELPFQVHQIIASDIHEAPSELNFKDIN